MGENFEKKAIRNDLNKHDLIEKTNKTINKEIDTLKIALLNLKIEDGRISESTGIIPIADLIEKVINNLSNDVTKLIVAFGELERKGDLNE